MVWYKYTMIICFVCGSLFLIAQTGPSGNENIKPINATFESEVVRLVNIERKKKGLSPVKIDRALQRSARYHAYDMAKDEYFEHASYDCDINGKLVCVCGSSSERIRRFLKKKVKCVAENIAAGQRTPEAVMKSWMKSSGHRSNILNPDITHIGVGYYKPQVNRYRFPHYWVQNFRCAAM